FPSCARTAMSTLFLHDALPISLPYADDDGRPIAPVVQRQCLCCLDSPQYGVVVGRRAAGFHESTRQDGPIGPEPDLDLGTRISAEHIGEPDVRFDPRDDPARISR